MKNLLIVLVLFFGFSVMGIAQDATKPAKKEQAKTKVAAPAKKAEAKKAEAAKPIKAEAKKEAVKPSGLKKDGTPDKRFKANETKPAAGPLKKDGSPDMRYKANKDKGKEKAKEKK